MKSAVTAFLALALATPAMAATPRLSGEQQTLLRCSAMFGIVASEQARDPGYTAYPPLGERGREYFVRAAAQLMDELHLDRDRISALLQEEVARLQADSGKARDPAAYVDGVMQPCLLSLTASGL